MRNNEKLQKLNVYIKQNFMPLINRHLDKHELTTSEFMNIAIEHYLNHNVHSMQEEKFEPRDRNTK